MNRRIRRLIASRAWWKGWRRRGSNIREFRLRKVAGPVLISGELRRRLPQGPPFFLLRYRERDQ